MQRFSYILFLLLTLFSVSAFAETEMRVYGYVFTASREPAPFVTVQVEGTTYGTTSRTDGYYDFNFKIQDTATIKYSFLGFEPYYFKVSTKHTRIQKLVFLNESATLLPDAEIKTFRDQVNTTDNLNLDKLKHLQGVTGGGIESLLLGGGVAASNEMTSQYSVRGGSYDENSVYVNDIEIYRPLLIRTGQQEGLSFINPDLVTSVNFSAGGFDAKYGDKMASVLDIKYKKPKKFEASVSGSLLGASAYVGQVSKNKKFTQLHGIRYKTSNYMLGSLPTDGFYDQRFIDYQSLLTYSFSKKWELSLLGNFSQNNYFFIPESMSSTNQIAGFPTTFQVYFDGQEKDVFQTVFGAATLKYTPNKNLSMYFTGSAFSTKEEVNYDIAGEYWLGLLPDEDDNSNATTLGAGAYLDYARNYLYATVKTIAHRGEYIHKKSKLEWGASFQEEFITDRINEFQLRDSAGYSLPYDPDKINLSYNLQSRSTLTSYRTQAFIQDVFKWRKFAFSGGLRANYWSFNQELLVSPRFTVAYLPRWKKDFVFRFSTGLYYQSPFYKEIRDTLVDNQQNVIVQLNNKIKAQRSLHFVLGSDYRFKWARRPFKFTSELYYKPADRVITYRIDNVKIIYSGNNDATAYTAGVDFKLFGEFVPGTDSWINLSLMNAKENSLNDNKGWVSRPNEQRVNFSMFFQDYFPGYPKYKVHLKFIWADGFPYWAPNAVRAENTTNRAKAYRRVDIGSTRSFVKGDVRWLDKTGIFKFTKSLNFGLEVFNLLNIENIESFFWVTDIDNNQNAISNALTGRRFNVRMSFDF